MAFGGSTLRDTYRIERPLGRGGMSVVYEAKHLRLGHTVAVKLMAGFLSGDADALARFRREAELLVALRHPHVVQVIDYDVTPDGEPFIVMERLEGETLAERLDRDGPFRLEHVVRIVEQLASALGHAHSRGVLHRDLKPNNVFLENVCGDELHAKLLDFGIAKNVRAERAITRDCMVGTPEYMAPEQATPWGQIDARADQYSLALLANELCTGKNPFWVEEDVLGLLHRVRVQNRPRLLELARELPPSVAAVIERGMSRAPADRYADVLELARELRGAARRSPSFSGGQRVCRRSDRPPTRACRLTPTDAFVLSRIDDGMPLEDLLDIAALPRSDALRAVERLFESGLIALV
jgi:serine/threonine-protein kinase